MKLWRCQNGSHPDKHGRLIFDFWAEKPVCPECGVDGEEAEELIIKLEIIHFDPPHPKIAGKGTGKRACSGKLIGMGGMASGDPNAVNCLQCRETKEWQDVAAKWEEEGGEVMRQSAIMVFKKKEE